MLKGDIGLFRGALLLAGFFGQVDSFIFNDDSKAKPKQPTRRLKLWFANPVFNAPQEQQQALEGSLRDAFGERIISMYFVEAFPWRKGAKINPKSLCIRLRD